MHHFQFYTKLDQTLLLGTRARNVQGLLEGIRTVPASSIYHHTHRFLQQHHYLSPEPPNDFAYWTSEVMGDAVLGEQFSSVDIVQFQNIEDLRQQFISLLERHLDLIERMPFSPPGEEFYFMATRLFVFPTDHVASSLTEFIQALDRISVASLYYHIFDAKLRLERGENDFSRWFADMGLQDLAGEIRSLDPYAHTLEGLRKRIIVLAKKHDGH